MSMVFGLMVHPKTIIFKRLRNALIDRRMNEFRTLEGNSIVYDEQALREGFRLLDSGGIPAILGDQSDMNESYYGVFPGRRAPMSHCAAFFALNARVPLFVGMCRSSVDGRLQDRNTGNRYIRAYLQQGGYRHTGFTLHQGARKVYSSVAGRVVLVARPREVLPRMFPVRP